MIAPLPAPAEPRFRFFVLTVLAMNRFTDVDGTVENTVWDTVALNTPFRVHEKSASRSSRSIANLSRPVTSCTPRGVENDQLVTSLMMVTEAFDESPTLRVVQPTPVALATVYPLS